MADELRSRLPLNAGLIALPVFVLAHLMLILRVEPVLTWFYPIVWWSYIFLADSIVYYRTGRSLIWDGGRRFWLMAGWSVVIWLLFEAFNLRLENWWYHNVIPERWLRRTGIVISFATVVPLLAQTDRLLESVRLFDHAPTPRLTIAPGLLVTFQIVGAAMLILTLAFPRHAFPLVWGGLVFLLEPINYRSGAASLLREWEAGSLRRVYRLVTAGLIAGGLWEFWNYWAVARWSYSVPFVGEWKIFEMPVLGFLGFPPFTLEAFVLYNFLCRPWGASIWPEPAAARPPTAPSRWVTLGVALVAIMFCVVMLRAIDAHTVLSFAK